MAVPTSKNLPHEEQHLRPRPMSVGTATNGNGPVMHPGAVPCMIPAGEAAAMSVATGNNGNAPVMHPGVTPGMHPAGEEAPMCVGIATDGNGPVMHPGAVPGMNPAGEEVIIMLEACCDSMELSLSVPMSSTDVLRVLVLDLRTNGP